MTTDDDSEDRRMRETLFHSKDVYGGLTAKTRHYFPANHQYHFPENTRWSGDIAEFDICQDGTTFHCSYGHGLLVLSIRQTLVYDPNDIVSTVVQEFEKVFQCFRAAVESLSENVLKISFPMHSYSALFDFEDFSDILTEKEIHSFYSQVRKIIDYSCHKSMTTYFSKIYCHTYRESSVTTLPRPPTPDLWLDHGVLTDQIWMLADDYKPLPQGYTDYQRTRIYLTSLDLRCQKLWTEYQEVSRLIDKSGLFGPDHEVHSRFDKLNLEVSRFLEKFEEWYGLYNQRYDGLTKLYDTQGCSYEEVDFDFLPDGVTRFPISHNADDIVDRYRRDPTITPNMNELEMKLSNSSRKAAESLRDLERGCYSCIITFGFLMTMISFSLGYDWFSLLANYLQIATFVIIACLLFLRNPTRN
ncbi:MAG: hypothetical protein GF411_13065 [Candidatus Lokiarchaeota archaeon]|nr:hypothetical protein [Candidatus Lokiarchaeota archaeon]